MEKFLEDMADVLEVDVEDITMDTNFRKDIEDWGSMMGFSVLVLLEDEYDTKLSVDEFLKCEKIADLYNKVLQK